LRVEDAVDAAGLVRRQRALGLDTGILFCVPIPEVAAIPQEEIEQVIARAVADTEAAGIHGPASTPAVLARVAELTDGRSVIANLALIEHDAAIAARLAVALAGARTP
jgi:pseudouridine-5'-phosphate glycosidase